MKITIRKPLGYSHIGEKDQQEDAVWPLFADVTTNNTCFVLCDGVGGSDYGEIASKISSKVIGEYLTERNSTIGNLFDTDIQNAVVKAYDELERVYDEFSREGTVTMATTLACVCFCKNGIMAAHMGDSRIYFIRPGQGLLYQSADHSLVNSLLQAGEITLEEAENYPRKSVITRAIQPHSDKRFNAEVQHLTDLQGGDYIFLCCDGVLEQLTNERLIEILSIDCSDNDKLSLLEAESFCKTKDNFTAYLIPIQSVEGVSQFQHTDEVSSSIVKRESKSNTANKETQLGENKQNKVYTRSSLISKLKTILLVIIILLIGFLVGYLCGNHLGSENNGKSKTHIEITKEKDDTKSKAQESQSLPAFNTLKINQDDQTVNKVKTEETSEDNNNQELESKEDSQETNFEEPVQDNKK